MMVDAADSPVDRNSDLAAHSLGCGRIAGLVGDILDRLGEGRSSLNPGIDCRGQTFCM